MATTKTKAAANATPAASAPAPKAKANPTPAAPEVAPAAPTYLYLPYAAGANGAAAVGWPTKATAGASVRAYCATVAQALSKAHPGGFTLVQLASAFAANAKGSTYKQPGAGWGSAETPNGTARQHANWFAATAQQWVVQVGTHPRTGGKG